MISIFADYAGDVKDSKQRVVVLATLIASDTQIEQINRYCSDLKNKVAGWDVDTSHEQFEFKTYEILQGSGLWRKLGEDKRIKVAKALRRVIWDSGLHFAVVLINKEDGGLRGIDEFDKSVGSMTDQTLATISEEKKHSLESLITKLLEKKGLGPLGNMTGLLFGLTTGLMHEKGLRDSAKLIMDDQFVKQIGAWELIFLIHEISWPLIGKLGLFPHWPKNNQPGWHLGDTLDPIDSRDSYGVQLADFVAYTTRRINEKPSSLADGVSVINEYPVFPVGDYEGIYFVTSFAPRPRRTYPKKTKRRR